MTKRHREKHFRQSERVAETCTLAAAGGFLACSNEQSADIAMLPGALLYGPERTDNSPTI